MLTAKIQIISDVGTILTEVLFDANNSYEYKVPPHYDYFGNKELTGYRYEPISAHVSVSSVMKLEVSLQLEIANKEIDELKRQLVNARETIKLQDKIIGDDYADIQKMGRRLDGLLNLIAKV